MMGWRTIDICLYRYGKCVTKPGVWYQQYTADGSVTEHTLYSAEGFPGDQWRLALQFVVGPTPWAGWRPFVAMVNYNAEIVGHRTPGMLYDGVTDIPSVTVLNPNVHWGWPKAGESPEQLPVEPYVLVMRTTAVDS